MIPVLAQISSLGSPWDADVTDYAAGQCQALEIWLGKLETYLQSHSEDDVRAVLDSHQMTMPVASFQGGLLGGRTEARQVHWDHFQRRLVLCRNLDIGTLVVAADIQGAAAQVDPDQVCSSLVEAADRAAAAGVRIALEFQTRSAFCNNLETALAVVAETNHANLGVCLDTFHFFTGPSKTEDLAKLTPETLFHVQLCDLAGRPRELATDADRILPGDGDLPLAALLQRLAKTGYTGTVSVELMNPRIWQVPARSYAEVAMTALETLLAAAKGRPGSARDEIA